jgi:hypothetical protein
MMPIRRGIFHKVGKMKHSSRRFGRIAWAVIALASGLIGFPSGANAQNSAGQVQGPAEAQTAGQVASINGFRNANFGMSQAQVLEGISSEFKISGSAVKKSMNDTQRTSVLSISVPDLLPGGGVASVSYIFGYQTHKLIEVNILWSRATDPKTTATTLYQNGVSLQQYFAGAGFAPDRSSGNIATPDGIELFRATDSNGNAVLLILSGVVKKDPKSDKATLDPAALTLAYAANPLHPDIYSLPKGSF